MSPTRRRYRKPILLTLVVLLLIAAGTAGAVVARYDPLGEGSTGGTPVTPPFHDADNDSGSTTRIIDYVQGAPLSVVFSVENRGRWAVRIVDLPGYIGAEYPYRLFHVSEIRRGVLGRCCVETEPFFPFTLHPGEERFVQLNGVMAGCGHFEAGSSEDVDPFPIRYRFWGLNRTRTIGTRFPVEIHIPDGYLCPESQPPTRR